MYKKVVEHECPTNFFASSLAELNMTASEVARILHVPANRIYQILQGKRAMTADTALRLSRWLGTSPDLWMNLQKLYELRLAEQQLGEEIRQAVTPLNRASNVQLNAVS